VARGQHSLCTRNLYSSVPRGEEFLSRLHMRCDIDIDMIASLCHLVVRTSPLPARLRALLPCRAPPPCARYSSPGGGREQAHAAREKKQKRRRPKKKEVRARRDWNSRLFRPACRAFRVSCAIRGKECTAPKCSILDLFVPYMFRLFSAGRKIQAQSGRGPADW
jgi:hypothetical protein